MLFEVKESQSCVVVWNEAVWGINKCMKKKNCVRTFEKYLGHTHMLLYDQDLCTLFVDTCWDESNVFIKIFLFYIDSTKQGYKIKKLLK